MKPDSSTSERAWWLEFPAEEPSASERSDYVLKKHSIDKALAHLYAHLPLPVDAHLVIFTWVIGDGLGDYAAQMEAAHLLRQRFASLKITLITLIPQGMRVQKFPDDHHLICYKKETHAWESILWEEWEEEVLNTLSSATLLLQMPTYYPHTPKLLQLLPATCHYELLGEYGWITTPYYDPATNARCMGLHPLEKGIFTKQRPQEISFSHFQDKKVLSLLLDTDNPSPAVLKSYKDTHRFNLAYTCTSDGLYLYIGALVKALEKDSRHIDIAFFNMHHLIEALEKLCLTGIQSVLIYDKHQVAHLPLANTGKTLRFILLGKVSQEDFSTLLHFTDDLFACRGDGSFSEAVSAEKTFFPDLREHKKNFLKDLISLAQHTISHREKSIAFLKLRLHNSSSSLTTLGELLQDPATQEGIKELCRIIQKDCSVNTFLGDLICRSLYLRAHPHIEILEQHALDQYFYDQKSCEETLKEIAELLMS